MVGWRAACRLDGDADQGGVTDGATEDLRRRVVRTGLDETGRPSVACRVQVPSWYVFPLGGVLRLALRNTDLPTLFGSRPWPSPRPLCQ